MAAVPAGRAAEGDACADPFHKVFTQVAPGVVRIGSSPGTSSGLVVSADGLVVTHRRLVKKNLMPVLFSDGRKVEAKVLLRDQNTQLAILLIQPPAPAEAKPGADAPPAAPAEAKPSADAPTPPQTPEPGAATVAWTAVPLGASADLPVGAWAATIAYPYGTDVKTRTTPSLSAGLLSARGKLPTKLTYEGDLLLTDAAMNAGSEGGALVDAAGRVIGILCEPQYHAETKTALNVALPVEVLADLLKRARENPDPPIQEEEETASSRTHGFLGVTGDQRAPGCRVQIVVPDGPAAKAGILPGDTITKIGDKPIANWADLVEVLKTTKPGDTVHLTVKRPGNDEPVELDVELGAYPEPELELPQ